MERQPGSRMAGIVALSRRLLAPAEAAGFVVATPLLLVPTAYSIPALVLLTALWLVRLVLRGPLARRSPADWPLLVLLAMTCVSLYPSVDLGRSLPRLYGSLLGFYLFTGIIEHVRGREMLRDLRQGLLLGAVLIGIVGLVGTAWNTEKLPFLEPFYAALPRLLGPGIGMPGGIHPNEVGGILAFLFPFATGMLLFGGCGRARGLCLVPVALTGLVLFMTASRAAWMGAALGIGSLALFRWPRLAWALAPGVAIGIGLWWLSPAPALQWLAALDESGTAGWRIDVWTRALYMVRDFPVTGVGLNTFPLVLERYPAFFGPAAAIHAHNTYLQTAVDLGLPGLAAFLVLLGVCVAGVARGRAVDPPLAAGLMAGLIGHLAYGLTDAVTLGARSMLLWAVLGISVALGARASENAGKGAAAVAWAQWALFATASGLGILIAVTGVRSLS